MQIKIRATNFELTPAIREYIERKIPHLDKFLENKDASLCEVEIGKTTRHHKSGDVFRAEINLTEPGGKQFYAAAEESDLYASIDIVRDDIERKIISGKKRRDTVWKRGAQQIKNIIKNFRNTSEN
jgi:ribosomal subunit interface protein